MEPRLKRLIYTGVFSNRPYTKISAIRDAFYHYKIDKFLSYDEAGVESHSDNAQKHSVAVSRSNIDQDWLVEAIDWCMENVHLPERWFVNGKIEECMIRSSIFSETVTFQFSRKMTAKKFAKIFQTTACCFVKEDQEHRVVINKAPLPERNNWTQHFQNANEGKWLSEMVAWIEENCTNQWSLRRENPDIWFENDSVVFSFADLQEATMFRLKF